MLPKQIRAPLHGCRPEHRPEQDGSRRAGQGEHTGPKAVNGKVAVDNFHAADSFAFAYRTDTGTFSRLPALGGLNSQALAVDRHGSVAGTAATTPPDAGTANGAYHAALWTPLPA